MANSTMPQWQDMQGLVVSSYPHLDSAVYVPLRIDDAAATRQWLGNVAGDVTNAFERSLPTVSFTGQFGPAVKLNFNIALTYSGLKKLRDEVVSDSDRDSFAYAFTEGVAGNPHRSMILGDTGPSDPANWSWGGVKNPVDLLLMMFADEASAIEVALYRLLNGSGMSMVVNRPLDALSLRQTNLKEHFGFEDGMSQPILAGTPDAARYHESIHVTALGEFVFGYHDCVNKIPPCPTLGGFQDFGLNGTYLVFRQLAQDVARFWNFVNQAAAPAGGATDPAAAELLASKIIGRRPDGTPLVPGGHHDDNEFDFSDDRHGHECPVGAHIRRAHPRRSLSADPLPREQINRHRLLRRSRSYGPKIKDRSVDDQAKRGLLFVVLNSDFERQFEFINQNWINNTGFAGLDHEADPLLGPRQDTTRFTVPGCPARTRYEGLQDFVTVTGGEYFFLPGIRALKILAGTV